MERIRRLWRWLWVMEGKELANDRSVPSLGMKRMNYKRMEAGECQKRPASPKSGRSLRCMSYCLIVFAGRSSSEAKWDGSINAKIDRGDMFCLWLSAAVHGERNVERDARRGLFYCVFFFGEKGEKVGRKKERKSRVV